MPKRPPIERLFAHYDGDYTAICEALGVAHTTPWRWRRLGYIPEANALDIEELGIGIKAREVLTAAREAKANGSRW